MNIKIGEIIENARRAKGLTQGQLAKKLGVSNTAISKWEHGYNLPDIALLEPISKTLDIDVMHLLQLENATKEDTSSKNKNKKIKSFINIILCILLFLSTVSLVGISISNHYKKKIDKIKSEQLQAYRFQSVDSEFAINGYIIFNNKENIIIMSDIVQQNKNKRSKEEKYHSAELQLYIGDERIARSKYKSPQKDYENLQDILKLLQRSLTTSNNTPDTYNEIYATLVLYGQSETIKEKIKMEIRTAI